MLHRKESYHPLTPAWNLDHCHDNGMVGIPWVAVCHCHNRRLVATPLNSLWNKGDHHHHGTFCGQTVTVNNNQLSGLHSSMGTSMGSCSGSLNVSVSVWDSGCVCLCGRS